nr:hypothetical protein [Tanacetum cinerariifolium]
AVCGAAVGKLVAGDLFSQATKVVASQSAGLARDSGRSIHKKTKRDDIVVRAQRRGRALNGAVPLVATLVVGGFKNLVAPAVENDNLVVAEVADAVNLPGVVAAVAVGREGIGDAQRVEHRHGNGARAGAAA